MRKSFWRYSAIISSSAQTHCSGKTLTFSWVMITFSFNINSPWQSIFWQIVWLLDDYDSTIHIVCLVLTFCIKTIFCISGIFNWRISRIELFSILFSRVFDVDGSGALDFQEFTLAMNCTHLTNPEDKLKNVLKIFLFHIFPSYCFILVGYSTCLTVTVEAASTWRRSTSWCWVSCSSPRPGTWARRASRPASRWQTSGG